MNPSVELIAGVVGIAALVIGFLVWRRSAGRSSGAKPTSYRGPTNMYFTCAGCSGQFAHTKRTVTAWEKGSRRVFCDACHKKWRNAQPPQFPPQRADIASSSRAGGARTVPAQAATARYSSEAKAPGGCLGVLLLLLLIPVVIFAVLTNA
ncbi:MAG: hypothetical protein IPH26_09415 [Sterolibacteriaceae bacterium]|uniref:Uncharacterized protein n=1 Tax=Candidatus Methylophosphatis roskildensis TaxID=2899263 RepID=A0A9D7E8P1_9PROT|nr:hypothetical protein [Candidatus Methylophosphatis roskildensis]MBK7238285.1 hypothetical protein [Sterolibacteriaceae bacterium]